MLAADLLIEAGFLVIEASHAAQALAALQAQPEQVHLLFTDIHMPGPMNGLDLAHHVRRHWPWIALLIASGEGSPADAEMPVGSRFLSKPYDPEYVVAHARAMTTA
jgi:CheY-like chemotaxis protein